VLVAVALLMALGRALGRNWWLAAAPIGIALAVSFAFLQGWVVAGGTTPVARELRPRIATLERRVGVDVPVREQTVSDWTSQPNAFAAGLGPSAHVVLWDTLLDGRFSRGEVDVVIAHELGHVQRHHIWKSLAWIALIAFPTLLLVELATRRRGGIGRPAALPLAFLALTLASLAALPIQNAVSRRYEAEADWVALQATRDPASARKLFRSFEQTSLEQPNPPLWDYVLLENHPTLAQRIAMAVRWRGASGR
jgi:STE24 endopeptidase